MPAVSLKERIQVNQKLKQMGFGGIHDPNLFAQIATLYSNHDSFRGLLMSTAPDQRRIAYEALKPHLSFEAKPLEAYELEVKSRAEREKWDIWDGTAYPKPMKVAEIESPEYKLKKKAEAAIDRDLAQPKGHLTLACLHCTKEQKFPGKTRVDAAIRARNAGWRLTPEVFCPECAEKYRLVQ